VIRNPAALSLSSEALPPDHVKRVVATLAISLAALLAEAGLRYLQRRLEQMPAPTIRLRRGKARDTAVTPTIRLRKAAEQTRVITVMSERVVEERRWGRPVRRVVERFAWRSEESQGE
jgi:hypothetical protein